MSKIKTEPYYHSQDDTSSKQQDDSSLSSSAKPNMTSSTHNPLSYSRLNPRAELYVPNSYDVSENPVITSGDADSYFYRYLSSLDYIATHYDILESLISQILPVGSYQDAMLDAQHCLSCSCMGDAASATCPQTLPSSTSSADVNYPHSAGGGFPSEDILAAADDARIIPELGVPSPADSIFNAGGGGGGGEITHVTPYGTISITLRHRIQVDITLDKAIRLVNNSGDCIAAINNTGDNCCIIHPWARILQEGNVTHIETKGQRLAKISNRGITFTSLTRSLVYLVDASGTKSTAEKFRDLQDDFSINVFYNNSNHGREAIRSCFHVLRQIKHKIFPNGDEIWVIGGIFLKQTLKGDVRVAKNSGHYLIKTSTFAGTISVITPHIYMVATKNPEEYLLVRRGTKQVKSSETSFNVKNGSQKAGFDNRGEIILI